MPVKILKRNSINLMNIFNKTNQYIQKVINSASQWKNNLLTPQQNIHINNDAINAQLQSKLDKIFARARFVKSDQQIKVVNSLTNTLYPNLVGLREYLQLLKYLRLHTEYSYSGFINTIKLSSIRRVQFIHAIYEQHLITCPAPIASINHHLVGLTEMYLLHNLNLKNKNKQVKNKQVLSNTIAFNYTHLR